MPLKKFLISLFLICTFLLSPLAVNGYTHKIQESDMSITFDETEWYVFTRENISGNKELDELGLTYDYMYNLMHENKLYLDAMIFYEDNDFIEVMVRKNPATTKNNMWDYSKKEILQIAELVAEQTGKYDYEIYEGIYDYIVFNYENSGYYNVEYCIVVNGYAYAITAQKDHEFTYADKMVVESLIDTIYFDVDKDLEEDIEKDNENDIFIFLLFPLGGGLLGGLIGLIVGICRKCAKKKKEKYII